MNIIYVRVLIGALEYKRRLFWWSKMAALLDCALFQCETDAGHFAGNVYLCDYLGAGADLELAFGLKEVS